MSPAQEAHLARVQHAFAAACEAKYRAGVNEHGGNLWEHPPLWLLDQVMQECVDQWCYAFAARENLLREAELHARTNERLTGA